MLALASVGCHPNPRYTLANPLWSDPDRNHVTQVPETYYSGLYADAVNQTFLRPLSDALSVSVGTPSKNVNTMDEVPDSSWFVNRIGLRPISPERAAIGSCTGPMLDTHTGPWLITSAKTEGVTPGLFIKSSDGQPYLLKFDGWNGPERASAADTIGSRIYWTAGYYAPCNVVVSFERAQLQIAPGATAENERGQKRPLSQADVDHVLRQAPLQGRLLRAMASRFLPGKPIGPHCWSGVRADDPNDVVPHEDRRELRAERLLAAWIDHFDVREQNSLDIYLTNKGRSYVRHYMLDFGDAFGSPWTDERLNRRVGYSYMVDLEQMFVDFLTLGAYPRPWWSERINDEAQIFGHYRWQNFDPTQWRSMYPHPAYVRMTWRDALWITRIIARFTDSHIRAIVKTGKLSNSFDEDYLVRTLIKRRDRIVRHYLALYVPLDRFAVVHPPDRQQTQVLCFEDLAIRYAGVAPGPVVYKLRVLAGKEHNHLMGWQQWQPRGNEPAHSCIDIPFQLRRPYEQVPQDAPDNHPLRHTVLKLYVFAKPAAVPTLVALHAYDLGAERGLRLVGVERLPSPRKAEEFYEFSSERNGGS